MEQFKAVEKEMKTKAYSKEGLSQNAKQDPEEKRRDELCDFLSTQLDEIEQFLEALDAEQDILQAAVKKKKNDNSKSGRLADIDVVMERFKWHEGKIQLLLRSLQNGNVDNNQVEDLKESIEYVVGQGREAEFEAEDPDLYDGCNLDGEEAVFGMGADNDKISSQDALSIQDEGESEQPLGLKKVKTEPIVTRRPSTQMKSPLPLLASLNTMPPPPPIPKDTTMKPAPAPARPPGEVLKYASAAAAAAAASDKGGVGIAPLPPPPAAAVSPVPALVPLPAPSKASGTTSPSAVSVQPIAKSSTEEIASTNGTSPHDQSKSPTLSQASARATSVLSSVPPTPALEKAEKVQTPVIADEALTTNGEGFGEQLDGEESIYHLPASLQDLIQSFETTKSRIPLQPNPSQQRLLAASRESCPDGPDAERPQHYKPQFRFNTPAHYPQEPLPIFDDPALYETGRIDTDTLFYIFYYRQGTYQQYLAAKSLKNQSWRFHKQYQTWFQRHEEPKTITEEFEQGTYRFFDYESTW